MIPLIDIGMDVNAIAGGFIICGQVALSLPGMPCLRCMGLLNEHEMKQEAERYGVAGGRPQVIWPNAVLASTAVGCLMQLVTPWHTSLNSCLLMEYDGNSQTVTPSNKIPYFPEQCPHFEGIENLGDPFWAST
jgi:molybdopterin-synthase adenylyltransferase